MRGEDQRSEGFFSYVRLDTRIPADHPLRAIRSLADEALSGLSRDFDRLYARDGRPSIPPERLLRALLLQAFKHGPDAESGSRGTSAGPHTRSCNQEREGETDSALALRQHRRPAVGLL